MAKYKTDSLINGETFFVETETFAQDEELVEKATALGAVCEIISND